MKLRSILSEVLNERSNKARVASAVNKIRDLGYVNRDDYTEIIINNKIAVEIEERNGMVWLGGIRSMDPGQGGASKVLKNILEIVDSEKVKIGLSVQPYGEGLTSSQLTSWYQRYGFVKTKHDEMMRLPE